MTDRLNIGVLGAAGIAKLAVVPAINSSRNARVAAVASRNRDAAYCWAGELGIPKVHSSYEALLADPDIDAVYIPLPNSEHARWSIAAAGAGKAVLCEKPVALNAAEAQDVVDVCARAGIVLMEGFMYRFHPQHARAREIIASGAIGDVVEVQAHLSVDLMSPPDPSNVRFAPELGGGTLLDMGCYCVHIARSVFGEEPESVSGTWVLDPVTAVDIAAAGVLRFPGGRLGVVSCSFQGNGQGSYRIVGRQGMIDLPRGIIPGLGDRNPEALISVVDANGARRDEVLAPVDQYRLMVEAFADAVLSGPPVPVDASDSVANLRVLDAFAASARSGSQVRLT